MSTAGPETSAEKAKENTPPESNPTPVVQEPSKEEAAENPTPVVKDPVKEEPTNPPPIVQEPTKDEAAAGSTPAVKEPAKEDVANPTTPIIKEPTKEEETAKATEESVKPNPEVEKTNADPAAESSAGKAEAKKDLSASGPPTPQRSVSFEKDAKKHDGSPVSKLFVELPAIMKEADYHEMWGIELVPDESHVQTQIILEKFLRANNKDVSKANAQLTQALKWRKEMQPLKLLKDVEYDAARFGNLGYVTTYETTKGAKEVITWNIYGAVKDVKATFSNTLDFMQWRAALMELSLRELNLAGATEKIPENGPDPYRMIQIHDYQNVSFLRMDPNVKNASREWIQTFSMAYPELLKEKFFVNVPLVMGWVFAAMKVFMSAATIKKFHPLSYGSSLAGELPELGDKLPKEYGGKGPDVKEGLTVKYSSNGAATA